MAIFHVEDVVDRKVEPLMLRTAVGRGGRGRGELTVISECEYLLAILLLNKGHSTLLSEICGR